MTTLSTPKSRFRPLKAALALSTLAISQANATWSILITDTRTGEFVLGSATCVTGFNLALETPVVLTGIGAITAQSAVDNTGFNRMYIRDRLLEGQPLSQTLADLALIDPGHSNRQYGMITTTGDSLTYSGIENANWAGGITGRIEQGRPGPQDDIVYTVQGNILSGSNVVQDAVNAIINTDSDLPGKLMAAMDAARQAGGDGRCSCSPNAPTGCGSPPPPPFKSAHVGYMIGSRADDTDSIRAFYELPATSTALTKLDETNFAISDTNGDIHIYTNATNTNDQVAHFNFVQTIQTNLPNLTKLTAADLDNNGLKDLVVLSDAQNIFVLFQSSANTFESPTQLNIQFGEPAYNSIETFDAKQITGDQLLLSYNSGIASYQLIGITLDRLNYNITESPQTNFHLDDFNNDNINEFLSIQNDTMGNVALYYTNPNGTFAKQLFLRTSSDPIQARSADINNDNLIDILVATGSSQVIDCFINTGTPTSPTFAPKISSPISSAAIDFQITDLNNDNIPDLAVVMTSGANFRYYLGDGNGNFTETNRTRIGGTPTNILLADLNNDGDQDLITNASNKLLIYDNLQNATVQRRTGFARGDKFMFINIPVQNAAAQDPVDQMLTKFAEFRTSLTNKIDAVQTTVSIPQRVLINSQPATIRIELRDYQLNLLTDPATFEFVFNPANLTPSLPILIEPGIYDIPISAHANPGPNPLKVKATTNAHTVTLMPTLTIPVTDNLADFNADLTLDFFDISAFITALTTHNPIADLNNDTLFDFTDVTLFLNAYKPAP